MSDNMTQSEYYSEVKNYAANAVEEVITSERLPPLSDRLTDEIVDEIHTDASTHEWVTYNGYSLDIIQASQQDPDDCEWYIWVREENNAQKCLDAMAFAVFRQDLYEAAMDYLNDLRVNPDDSNRHYTDDLLQLYFNSMNEGEQFGLKFGMFPADLFGSWDTPLAGGDAAALVRMMEDN